MKRSSYRERDYAFGHLMLTVRTTMGLTQTELAEMLGVRRRAVIDWEGGLTYPNVDHLKQFVVLAIERQAWPFGREAEEVRALWQAARQKVLLDEAWLGGLLSGIQAPPASQHEEETVVAAPLPDALASPSREERRIEWGNAPDVLSFYGREWEQDLLSEWVVEERCRVVSVLGQRGIGKSALATKVMHRVAEDFEVVIWRSLRDVPSCEVLLDDCLQVLAPQALRNASSNLESRQDLLLECLRSRRILLVYDNLESILEEGEDSGHMRPGYEGFARVLRRIAETEHQSCLLLTSREKPGDLVPLEGSRSPVRALRLARLDADSCKQLLAAKDITGTASELERLIEVYAGNPLALKIVAQTIVELFDGQITLFLEQGEVVFGGVRELLDEQFARLADLEQTILCWLAIVREPVTINELRTLLVTPPTSGELLEAVDGLLRRSLIERGQQPGSITLQSVVLEYMTTRLVVEASSEIEQGRLLRLIQHGLSQAHAKDYVRQTQERMLLAPLLARLQTASRGYADVEAQMCALLNEMRNWPENAQGYGPANLLALLCMLRGNLRGLDLSDLSLRGMYLQGVEMQDATLTGAIIRDTVFTEAFDAPWSVATSPNGYYWAAGSRRGRARVWREGGKILDLAWQAHTAAVQALAFSPNGNILATGSWDGAIKLWNLENGALLWMGRHRSSIQSLAFAPDGRMLASGGDDATIQLWDTYKGTYLSTLSVQGSPVYALAWSLDGSLLASGSFDGGIRLWEMQEAQPGTSMRILTGHTDQTRSVAFTPDGRTLASGSFDRTIKLWDTASGELRETLVGHTGPVNAVVWSPDGRILASCSRDQTIWLWDFERGNHRMILHGHTAVVHALAFTPDGRSLLSGSEDGTLRVWDVERGQSVHIIQGFAVTLYDVAWSPDGTQLASAGSDRLVTIWDSAGRTPPRLLRGHSWIVYGVAWSSDGTSLASGGYDGSVILWVASDGTQLARLQGHRDMVMSVAWSPDGMRLARGGGGRGSGELFVWDAHNGERLLALSELSEIVYALAWSQTGAVLVSGDSDGMLRWWDVQHGECVQVRRAHQGTVQSLKVSPDGSRLASCGDDGAIHVWDLESTKHLRTLLRDRPYERLDITGIRGVTEAQKSTLRALGAIENPLLPDIQYAP